jgi:hypothetical protein
MRERIGELVDEFSEATAREIEQTGNAAHASYRS